MRSWRRERYYRGEQLKTGGGKALGAGVSKFEIQKLFTENLAPKSNEKHSEVRVKAKHSKMGNLPDAVDKITSSENGVKLSKNNITVNSRGEKSEVDCSARPWDRHLNKQERTLLFSLLLKKFQNHRVTWSVTFFRFIGVCVFVLFQELQPGWRTMSLSFLYESHVPPTWFEQYTKLTARYTNKFTTYIATGAPKLSGPCTISQSLCPLRNADRELLKSNKESDFSNETRKDVTQRRRSFAQQPLEKRVSIELSPVLQFLQQKAGVFSPANENGPKRAVVRI